MDTVLGIIFTREVEEVDAALVELLEQRQQARAAKNWAEADRIRDEFAARGWVVQDTPNGPKLKKLT